MDRGKEEKGGTWVQWCYICLMGLGFGLRDWVWDWISEGHVLDRWTMVMVEA